MANEDPIVPAHGTIPDTGADIQSVIAANIASNATVSPNWPRARDIIALHLDVLPENIQGITRFCPFAEEPNLGADSLDMVELVMAFEEEFGVEITDDEAEKVVIVADAITLIDSKTAMS